MDEHALAAPRTTVRPAFVYAMGATVLLLALTGIVAGLLRGATLGALVGALVFALVGVLLLALGRSLAVRRDGFVRVEAGGVVVVAPRALRRSLTLRGEELAEAIVDPEGVRVGADRLRFPATGSVGERRFLHGRSTGGLLFEIPSQRGAPNVALVFRERRALPLRPLGSRVRCTGIALAAADPVTLAAALSGVTPTRVADGTAGLPLDVQGVEVVGVGERVMTRGERASAVVLTLLTFAALGVAEGAANAGHWGRPFVLGLAGAAVGVVAITLLRRRRLLPRP